jgi:hypothetical protein
MPKTPIWLTDEEKEVLRGYLGELLDNNQTPDEDVSALFNAYKQTLEKEE